MQNLEKKVWNAPSNYLPTRKKENIFLPNLSSFLKFALNPQTMTVKKGHKNIIRLFTLKISITLIIIKQKTVPFPTL